MLHKLQTERIAFQPVWDGFKTFDSRESGPGPMPETGDDVQIIEYDGCRATGRSVFARAEFVLRGPKGLIHGVPPGYTVVGLSDMRRFDGTKPAGHQIDPHDAGAIAEFKDLLKLRMDTFGTVPGSVKWDRKEQTITMTLGIEADDRSIRANLEDFLKAFTAIRQIVGASRVNLAIIPTVPDPE